MHAHRCTIAHDFFEFTRFYQFGPHIYPSYSTLTEATMSSAQRQALSAWRAKLVEQLGVQGAQEMMAMFPERGTAIHEFIEGFALNGHWPAAFEVANGDKYVDFLRTVKNTGYLESCREEMIIVQEAPVWSHHYGVAGTPDRISYIPERNAIRIRDWKTSQKPKGYHEKRNRYGYKDDLMACCFPHYFGASYNSRNEGLAARLGQMYLYMEAYCERRDAGDPWFAHHPKTHNKEYELVVFNNCDDPAKNPDEVFVETWSFTSKDVELCDAIADEIQERVELFTQLLTAD